MINIVLADDHKIVRKGLKALLSTEADFNVVGEVEDGLEALSLVEKSKPDILLLDLMMPGLNGLEVARVLSSRGSSTRIVILSMHNCGAYVSQAFKSGASAYVLKDAPPEELMEAIREAAAGHNYLCSGLSEKLMVQEQGQQNNSESLLYQKLTPREKEIMILAANGLTSKDIAARLYISVRTVETHRTALMQKLYLHNQIHLVQFAGRIGILSHESRSAETK